MPTEGETWNRVQRIDKELTEKQKAQIIIWRLQGFEINALKDKVEREYGLSGAELVDSLKTWLQKKGTETEPADLAKDFLNEIHRLKLTVDNSLVLDLPASKVALLLSTMEVYTKIYKELPKTHRGKKSELAELYLGKDNE